MKRKMMITFFWVAAILGLALIVGLLLPAEKEFIKTATLKSPPDKVFREVTDIVNQTNWRKDIKAIQMLDDSTWTEIPLNGSPLTFRTRKKIQNELFEIEIIAPKNIKGYWRGSFEKFGGGTKITFREVVVIKNPLYRLLSYLFVDLDKTMDLYLTNLQAKLLE